MHREAGRVANNQSMKSRSVVGGTLVSRGAGHSYSPYKKPAMEVRNRRLCQYTEVAYTKHKCQMVIYYALSCSEFIIFI